MHHALLIYQEGEEAYQKEAWITYVDHAIEIYEMIYCDQGLA